MSELLRALKIAAVPHGFRSSFRAGPPRRRTIPKEIVEAALARVSAEQGRGRLVAFGPVRAPTSGHERLGRVSGGRASRPGGRIDPLTALARDSPPFVNAS